MKTYSFYQQASAWLAGIAVSSMLLAVLNLSHSLTVNHSPLGAIYSYNEIEPKTEYNLHRLVSPIATTEIASSSSLHLQATNKVVILQFSGGGGKWSSCLQEEEGVFLIDFSVQTKYEETPTSDCQAPCLK